MPAESAPAFSDLEDQARLLTGVFAGAGFELVAPSILQPAGIFLDVIGDELRSRTYVFNDPDGGELCLRPDLTVPACRLYLERVPQADKPARYAYNGAAFRYQPGGPKSTHPREFRQAGIESFGAGDPEAAEAEIVGVIVKALHTAGLERFTFRIGDLGIFRALLAAIDIPERWRASLTHHFWRPDAFHAHLKRLCTDPARAPKGVPARIMAQLDPSKPLDAEDIVARHLAASGIELQGLRTLPEITGHLLEHAADARAKPLPASVAALIEAYVKVRARPDATTKALAKLTRAHGIKLDAALSAFDRRIELVEETGLDLTQAEFAAEFGRNLEYYTGFVFQVEAPELGSGINIAGGGRYDGLLKAVGAPRDVPAVGSAIHTERLLALVGGGQ